MAVVAFVHSHHDFCGIEAQSHRWSSNLCWHFTPREPRMIMQHDHPLKALARANTKVPPSFKSTLMVGSRYSATKYVSEVVDVFAENNSRRNRDFTLLRTVTLLLDDVDFGIWWQLGVRIGNGVQGMTLIWIILGSRSMIRPERLALKP